MNDDNLARLRDQFYTQEVVAKECLEQLLSFISFNNPLWLEPSAGCGVFLEILKQYGYTYLGLDIEPKHTDVYQQDFLQFQKEDLLKYYPNLSLEDNNELILIGNPPFGKNSSLAIKFFNHGAQYSQYIAMILPATFEKESVKKRLNSHMHLIYSTKLQNNLFYLNDKLVSVPTVFQIWEKRAEKRITQENKFTSIYFNFVEKEVADFAIQRVGMAAGKVKKEFAHLAKASHYFIKGDNELYDLFNKIDWSEVKYNTAGNPSISKQELIRLLEKQIELKNFSK